MPRVRPPNPPSARASRPRLVGEGDGEDLPRIDALLDQARNAESQHRVLPEPAPAKTKSGPSVVRTASRWGSFRYRDRWTCIVAPFAEKNALRTPQASSRTAGIDAKRTWLNAQHLGDGAAKPRAPSGPRKHSTPRKSPGCRRGRSRTENAEAQAHPRPAARIPAHPAAAARIPARLAGRRASDAGRSRLKRGGVSGPRVIGASFAQALAIPLRERAHHALGDAHANTARLADERGGLEDGCEPRALAATRSAQVGQLAGYARGEPLALSPRPAGHRRRARRDRPELAALVAAPHTPQYPHAPPEPASSDGAAPRGRARGRSLPPRCDTPS